MPRAAMGVYLRRVARTTIQPQSRPFSRICNLSDPPTAESMMAPHRYEKATCQAPLRYGPPPEPRATFPHFPLIMSSFRPPSRPFPGPDLEPGRCKKPTYRTPRCYERKPVPSSENDNAPLFSAIIEDLPTVKPRSGRVEALTWGLADF